MTKVISAKFDSKCLECGKKVKVGQTVTWEKGKGVYCSKCKPVNKQKVSRQSAAPQSTGRYVKCWECGCSYYDSNWYPGKDSYCGC